MKSNFINRLITGIVLLVVLFILLKTNIEILTLVVIVLSNIAIFEFSRALSRIGYNTLNYLAYAFNTVYLFVVSLVDPDLGSILLWTYAIVLFCILIFKKGVKLDNILPNILIAVYISVSVGFLLRLNHFKWILFALLITIFSDTFAYLVGRVFGKHKLNERLSPKKTVEGAVGGVFGALVFAFLFQVYFKMGQNISLYIASIIISVLLQIGDLFASYIKRLAGLKDYGNILKGHGGIMDRFDSLLFVSPLVYGLVYLLEIL